MGFNLEKEREKYKKAHEELLRNTVEKIKKMNKFSKFKCKYFLLNFYSYWKSIWKQRQKQDDRRREDESFITWVNLSAYF